VLGEYGSKPEVSLPRRLPAVCSGYALCRLISAREPCSAFLLQRLEPLRRAGLGHVLNRLWLAALRGGRCLLFVEFVDAPTFHLRVEHLQGSAAGVDLIVMCEIGEAFENAKQLLVP